MYCREFWNVYNTAGIASFHPSPKNTDAYNCSKRTVAGVEGGSVCEMSYKAIEMLTASLMTSLRNTAVELI